MSETHGSSTVNSEEDSGLGDELRTAWQRASDERTPESLDSRVLHQAAAAVNRRRWRPSVRLQALAFAAALVLGVAVVLNVQAPLRTNFDDAAPARPAAGLQDAGTVRQRFEKSADNAARSLEGAAESAPASLAAGREGVGGTAATPETSIGVDRSSCDARERSSAGRWWRCAQALTESGDEQAARRELELLQLSFPDFVPPE